MCTMKQACDKVGISYETLRFYCDEGLIPNVKRDKNNYRDFDKYNLEWIKGLQALRQCGMSIKDMKKYLELCIQGEKSIPERKKMLALQKEVLKKKQKELQESIYFIDKKDELYNSILSGEKKYVSHIANGSKLS